MTNKEQAIWKSYPDYPFIEANQFGEVRIKDRVTIRKNGVKYHVKGRVLKQHFYPNGYMYVKFSVNGKRVYLLVHRIVASVFIPNPDNLPEVNHKDNNPKNNSVDNLEWCTHQENIAYRERCGVSASEALGRPVFAVNLKTKKVLYFETQSEAARKLGASSGNICNVLKGKLNKTCNCWFCYADKDAVEKTKTKFGDKVANEVEELLNKTKEF